MLVLVGALTIVAGAVVAQTEQGSGHDMHGAKVQGRMAGHHEMIKNHMSMRRATWHSGP